MGPVLVQYVCRAHSGQSYLSNTDEDDEDGGRAAVGPFQVLLAGIYWKHPLGDWLLEPLTASHRSVAVILARCAPELLPISVHGKRLLLLEVDVLHHGSSPTRQIAYCDLGGGRNYAIYLEMIHICLPIELYDVVYTVVSITLISLGVFGHCGLFCMLWEYWMLDSCINVMKYLDFPGI